MAIVTRCLLLAFLAYALSAQSLELYSEFQRPDPFGNIVKIDRAETPREILSPAVARGAHASFHLAVSVPIGENYFLYVASNPEDACAVRLYREHFTKSGAEWIPDSLQEVRTLPDFGVMPEPAAVVPGQTTRVYLLDLAIPPDAKSGRFRVEAQLKVGTWIVRPLEIRVTPAQIPTLPAGAAATPRVPAVEEGADASAVSLLTSYFSGRFSPAPIEPHTVREIILRDVMQDLALAGPFDPAKPAVRRLWESRGPRAETGAEWYLKIRDYLYSAVTP